VPGRSTQSLGCMDASRAAEVVLSEVIKLAAGSYAIAYDGPSRIDDSNDDYVVEREICIQPGRPFACPVELWLTEASVGMGFDTWRGLGNRVGAASANTRFVFGFEPMTLDEKQIRSILLAIFNGHVEAQYIAAWGKLLHASGRLLSNVGIPRIQASGWGNRFSYQPYAA
jgi:hypothetical protein